MSKNKSKDKFDSMLELLNKIVAPDDIYLFATDNLTNVFYLLNLIAVKCDFEQLLQEEKMLSTIFYNAQMLQEKLEEKDEEPIKIITKFKI